MRNKILSGTPGLDEVLYGGFVENSTVLLRGGPGSGKTTIGLQFLSNSARSNKSPLFITLGEPVEHIKRNAQIIGISFDHIHFLDLSPDPDFFSRSESYDIFTPADVEREPTTNKIVETVRAIKPSLVFIDAMTQLRYLSNDEYQFRRQVLSFLNFLQEMGATVLFTSENSEQQPDDDLKFMADCVISLENNIGNRYLTVEKMRGSDFLKGKHSYKISNNGLIIFPNIIPPGKPAEFGDEKYSFGLEAIDLLTGGGIESATITIFSGPSGVGKSTLALQLSSSMASTGYGVDFYSFEEEINMLLKRAENIGQLKKDNTVKEKIRFEKVEPLIFSADEFTRMVVSNAQNRKSRLVVIDSISGFKLSLNGQDIVSRMHALCKTLQGMGIAVLLIHEVEHIAGYFKISEERLSYLADNIIFLHFLELQGSLHKSIGVLKKRLSNFEKTLRKFDITENGIVVGEPMNNLQGIITGIPQVINNASS
jgi:circadian clock protein KaiC